MKIALVTGTTKGIGYSVTKHLIQNKFIILALSRNKTRLQEIRTEFGPESLDIYPCDIANAAQVESTFQTIAKKHAHIDLIVNNAGIGYFESFQSTTHVHWNETIQTNLSGPFFVTQQSLPFLKKSKQPHIINICSTASRKGFPGCTSYAASKFGLLGMTEVWREELRSDCIKVTAVIPGPVRTPFWQSFENRFDTTLMISPDDVAKAILWIYQQPSNSSIEEILIKPITGDL